MGKAYAEFTTVQVQGQDGRPRTDLSVPKISGLSWRLLNGNQITSPGQTARVILEWSAAAPDLSGASWATGNKPKADARWGPFEEGLGE